MKTTIKYIMCALISLLFFTACESNDDCSLSLTGNCLVEEISLDNYKGDISLATHSIVVRVPETCNTSKMKITALKISDGATTDIAKDGILNMDTPQSLRIKSGDLYMDWNLSVLRDEARILSFVVNDIYTGIINQADKTINVYVPATVDVKTIIPTVEVSVNASVAPISGSNVDFSTPIKYVVTNNTANSEYTVTVHVINKPKALFVGAASNMSLLDIEAKTACTWMLANISESMYASFADLQANAIDLSECKIIWWHYHKDGGVDGHDKFVENAPEALNAKNNLRSFYENGGAFLLTRYATNLPSFIGVTGDDEWTTPNNCWGQKEMEAEKCNGPWDFIKYNTAHPLYEGTIDGSDVNRIYCTDAGYHITNSTAQYHINTDWGGYDNHAAWEARTGGKILGVGGDGAVVAWEYPSKAGNWGKGGIICIGSGCFDWYSYMYEPGYTENFHRNIAIMTQNAFNYLTK